MQSWLQRRGAGRAAPLRINAIEDLAIQRADQVVTHSSLVREVYAHLFPAQMGKVHPEIVWDVPASA